MSEQNQVTEAQATSSGPIVPVYQEYMNPILKALRDMGGHPRVGRSAMVYPSPTGVAREAVVEINDMEGTLPQVRVALRPFDLNAVLKILDAQDHEAGEKLAHSLVYGV
jgi:hypothetical protein